MAGLINRIFPWIVYPAVMLFALGMHAALLVAQLPLTVSTYTPVLICAVLVTLFELRYPNRPQWRPGNSDVLTDAWFMVIVQILLPKLLILLIAFTLTERLSSPALSLSEVWPHHWPALTQAILMMLIADFFRYWLHRFAHNNKLLWRLHAVHHSPTKLYWMNVGRFHPLEKALQFLLDALPFILLNVSESVVAWYFVFYAVNGFFQHCNIRVHLGVFNYIISSAELHRWHHSQNRQEANTNYGNNLIIWDLLFNTWFFPEHRAVKRLGLTIPNYPRDIVGLLTIPFLISHSQHAKQRVQQTIQNIVSVLKQFFHTFSKRMFISATGLFLWVPMVHAAKRPMVVQNKVRTRILAKNSRTRFGQKHKFEHIYTYDEFKRQIPIHTYEDLRPYLQEQEATSQAVLLQDPVIMYAQTSGTTGRPKYIPVSSTAIQNYKRQQRLFCYYQYHSCPQAFSGKVLGIVSPGIEGYMESGLPYGSVSGYIYKTMPKFVKRNYVLPNEVFDIKDYDLKYTVILRLALAERNITHLGCANPSSLLRLLDILNVQRNELVKSLVSGELNGLNSLAPEIEGVLASRLRPDPKRAAELHALSNKKEITFGDLWPNIRMVTTWTGGSCGIALASLQKSLPAGVEITELGYIASEIHGSLTVDAQSNAGIPNLQNYFYEFVECSQWENGIQECLALDQLEPDKKYYVIVTTDTGLYRYFMNDIVQVTGFFQHTPLIRFLQKGKGVTNVTGEKMYESHFLEAVKLVEQECNLSCRFFLALADEENAKYETFLELHKTYGTSSANLAVRIDQQLRRLNMEYAAKRASGRLQALDVHLLNPGTADAFKRFCIKNGQREGQFKTIALDYKRTFRFPLHRYVQ